MNDWLALFLAGSATALATGLGAIPVFLLGERAKEFRPLLWGMAAGLMGVAAIVGLILPGLDDGTALQVGGGALAGVIFLLATRRWIGGSDVHIGELRGADLRRAVLVFGVLFVHSLPEGFAIGTAYASDTVGLGLFVIIAIALQNIPEGTSVAIPMQASGFGPWAQFWAAVGTSLPQPIGALIAFALVEEVSSLLPVSFGFAAGAMLALVVVELVPQAFQPATWKSAMLGFALGAGVMLALSAALGV
jgi:ZIP family zinc transporter